ncbi:MAG TPA: hypothetical protein VGG27_14165 [Magnetospirillaceae bacterium]|jgi:hypothetical protein
MRQVLVRYKTKPECADENARLIGEVYKELAAKAPVGLRYMTLRLPDGTFIHYATIPEGVPSVTALESFKRFDAGIKDRCVEPPVGAEPVVVGSYGFVGP